MSSYNLDGDSAAAVALILKLLTRTGGCKDLKQVMEVIAADPEKDPAKTEKKLAVKVRKFPKIKST